MNNLVRAGLLAIAVSTAALAQLTITSPPTLPTGVIGNSYSTSLTATGAVSFLFWTELESPGTGLPPGLSLSSDGQIQGTPTVAGSYTFRIGASDSEVQAVADFTLNIDSALSITTGNPLNFGTAGVSYSQTLNAVGGTTPYGWSVVSGVLPPGLALNSSSGVISGIPTLSGLFNLTIQVRDSATPAQTASSAFSITIAPAPLTIVTTSPLTAGTVSTAYSQNVVVSGGTTPYVWAITSGSPPAGLTLNSSTGAITGTPTTAGTANFTIQVQDSGTTPQFASRAYALTINPSALTITTTSPLTAGTVSTAYSNNIAVTGGTPSYTWSVTAGSLPAGLTLNGSTGAISGTPTTAGTANFTIQVQDSAGSPQTQSRAYALTINPGALTITTASPLTAGTVSTAYSQNIAVTGGTSPYTWSVTAGSLPAGLTLNGSTGVIGGTPTTAGTANFTIQVQDSAGSPQTQSRAYALTINPGALTIITASPLTAGTVSTAYSQNIAVTGGTSPYTWSVTAGSLPAGLTLNGSTGAISGTPTTAGTANFTIQVQDSAGSPQTQSRAYALTINPAALTITTASPLTAGTVSTAYSHNIAVTGGTSPYTWSVTAGSLPAGLTLNGSTGVIGGTPTTAGTANFTIQVQDSAGSPQTQSRAYTLTINPAALSINTNSPLTAGTVSAAYSQNIAVTGGTTPYAWSVTAGSLPAGLTLNGSTGVISGTPTTAGIANFTIQVQDSAGSPQTQSRAYALTINPAALSINTNSPLTAGTVSTAYSQNIGVTGGTTPYAWSVTVGSLPAGLTLNGSTGVISGTPTTAGTANFTIQVQDSTGSPQTQSRAYALTINPAALSINTNSPLTAGTVSTAYSQNIAVTGGTTSYAWSVTAGSLPAGLTLNGSTGTITGTPTTAGTSNFTIQVQDSAGSPQTQSRAYALTINPAALSINTNSPLPAGTVSTAYSQNIGVTGGTTPYAWSVTAGSLPAGLTLNGSTGAITGTPTTAGTSNFTIQVQDSSGTPGTQTRAYALTINPATLSINTNSPLTAGTVSTAYSQSIAVTGGTTPYAWSVTVGSLPAGLTLNGTTGAITGTPTTAGTSNFTIQVQDSSGTPGTQTRAYALTINPATLSINTNSPLTAGTVSTAYSQSIAVTGGTTPYAWSVTVGSLPAGLTLTGTTGAITGTPTTAGTSNFTIQVQDSAGTPATQTRAYALTINPATLSINTNSPLTAGTVSTAYSQSIAVTGGTTPYAWSVTVGSLPAGLTLNGSTGAITGTPTTAGTSNFTIQVQDSAGTPGTQTRAYALTINPATLSINTNSPLTAGTVSTAYSQSIVVTGGTTPYAWSVTVGSLPAGLTLTGTTGAITGTPTTAGTSNFTIQVQDSAGTPATQTRAYALTINPATLSINTNSPLTAGTVSTAYSQSIAVTGGTTPYTWSVTVGSLPAGLTLNGSTGAITGTPTTAGTSNFTIQVQDSAGTPATQTRAYALTINPATLSISTASPLSTAIVNRAHSNILAVTGGVAPFTWSITTGSLPSGLTLNSSTGRISGTATTLGSFTFTIRVQDSSGSQQSATKSFALLVLSGELTISSTSPLAPATQGSAYSFSLAATGGTAPYSNWTITSGALPGGLSLNASTGMITGTPTTLGRSDFVVQVRDASSPLQFAAKALSLTVYSTTLAIQSSTLLPSGTLNQPYNYDFLVTGGTPPYSFSPGQGTVPPGLSITSSGSLTGTPLEQGTYTFDLQVFDSADGGSAARAERALSGNISALASQTFTIHINSESFTISPTSLPDAVLNSAYSQTLTANGGMPSFNWGLALGSLPNGMSLDSSGQLSGTPTEVGVFPITVTASDQAGNFAVQPYEFIVGSGQPTITTASPVPNGVINIPYSLSLTTTGGTVPYVYSLNIESSLPPGLTMTPAGVISGTPTVDGFYNFTVQVLDAAGRTDSKALDLFISLVPPLTITSGSPLPNANVGTAYSQTLTATGGSPPYTWTAAPSSLPPGLTLSSAGVLSGTPIQTGTVTFSVEVRDTNEGSDEKSFTLTVGPPVPLTITTSTLTSGLVGASYSQSLAATGGIKPYSWALSTGTLPPGLTITSGGVIQGAPTTAGNFTFTPRVTDSVGVNAIRQLSITVNTNGITITTPSALPDATINTSYSQQLAATGGSGNYGWQVTAGALPAGLSLNSSGSVSGTPTQSGDFTFTVLATDLGIPGVTIQTSKVFTLTVVNPGPVITTPSLPPGQALVTYSFTLASAGGTPQYTYSLVSGTLPSGIGLSPAGQILGTPGDAGSASFTVQVTDRAGLTATKQFTLFIGAAPTPVTLPLEIGTTTLPEGNVGRLYVFTFAARNGVPPFRWATSGLPAGLQTSAAGEIIGTPQTAGTSLLQVVVTDDARGRATGTFNLVIKPPQVVITTERAPDGRVNEPYSAAFAATGGAPPYTFSVINGSLPPGVAISPAGVASGTPTSAATYQFALQATDSLGEKASRAFSVVIRPPALVITTATVGNGVVSVPFRVTLAASGGTPPYKWSASGLPDGLTLDGGTGTISGTPTKNGTFTISAQVSDSDNQNNTRAYPVEIATQLSVATQSVGNMVAGTPVSTSLGANGGTPPYSWSVQSGSLPSGVTLNADGVISGTPATAGDFNFTAQVRDANNTVAVKAYSVKVVTPLVLTTQTLPAAPFGATYSTTLEATGGTPPNTWSIATGSLPAGLTLSSAGTITGTPTAAGTSNFTVQVSDSGTPRQLTQRAFSLQVTLPDISGVTVTVPANPPPGQQTNIGVSIGAPYPVNVTGTLTLTFSPNAANNADDPAIQFSTGGRTVTFTISAGQTQAVFPTPTLGIQTGTTAGTITLTTALQAGGSPINCNCQLNQTIIVARTAPVLSAVRVTRTATGFNVVVTGFSTTREVTQGVFRFAGTTNLQTTELTVALTATFNTYFQSEAAAGVGGQFTLSIPFTIQGDTATVNSVTVVLSNSVGSSQPVTATF